MQKSPSAVFIGQSPIDIITAVDDSFLAQHDIVKHSTKVISADESVNIMNAITIAKRLPGGGAANSACMFSQLHGMAIFNGKIADDDEGRLFLKSLTDFGVNYANDLFNSDRGSDLIYTLITPDNERSFAACYEISSSMSLAELDSNCITGSDLVFLEGFLLNIDGGFDTNLNAARLAKADNKATKVAFCPCDPQIVQNYSDQVRELIDHTDILIMNEHEATELFPAQSIEEITQRCLNSHEAGAITLGKNGAIGWLSGEMLHAGIAPIQQDEIINTNGAGDAFTGGFLHSVLSGKNLKTCLDIAQKCAGDVLKRPGAR